MPVQTQVVRFQKDSSGVEPTTQDVNLNFTPSAIIVISSGNATADSVTVEFQQSIGFSDGTNHISYSIGSDNGAPSADNGNRYDSSHVFTRLSQSSPGVTTLATATCSFSTNKVTFTWDLNDTAATWITLYAIGGSDITNVKVGVFATTTTTNGATENYTGLGWNPAGNGNSVLFVLKSSTGAGPPSGGAASGMRTVFGCATSSSKQWCDGLQPETVADPTDTWRVHYSDKIAIFWDGAGVVTAFAGFNAWITDGFQLVWTDAPSSTNLQYGYMVIEGGTWDVGNLTAPTSATNDVSTTVSVSSRTIKGLLLSTVGTTVSGTVASETIYSLGVTDGTNHDVEAGIDEDNQASVDNYRYTSSSSIIYLLTLDGVLTDRATFDSFGTNSFSLDYPTKSADAQLVGWVVVANTTADAAVTTEISYQQSYGNIFQQFDSNKNTIFG